MTDTDEKITITEKQYLDWLQEWRETTDEINRLKQLRKKLGRKLQGYLILKEEVG
jgi:hypothetical protein